MGQSVQHYCDVCQDEVDGAFDLATLTIGGEVREWEVCEACIRQVWARVKPILEGAGLKLVG